MTEEKLKQATAYLSRVRGAEEALNKLGRYKPHAALFGIIIGEDYIDIENELAEQIVKLATDYFQKKESRMPTKI